MRATEESRHIPNASGRNWLPSFRLQQRDFSSVGHDLRRPECVVALRSGEVIASDRSAAVTVINPDGSQFRFGFGVALSNTFCLNDNGDLVVADLQRGTVIQIDRKERASLLHDTWEGEALGSVNFVLAGEAPGVAWLSVATRDADYRTAIDRPRPDGRIFRIDGNGIALAADNLFFPNAMQIDHRRGLFYVIETTAGAVSRAEIQPNGSPGPFRRFGLSPVYPGAYTDGLALDSDGNVWVTELSRNAILILNPDGELHKVFEDPEGSVLNKPTGLAFGGEDQRTVFVGSLKMSVLPTFRSPVPGHSPRFWRNGITLSCLRSTVSI